MDSTLPSTTPEPAQTHDAIVALLRDHPQRPAHDPSALNIAPGADETVAAAPSIAPAVEVEPAAPATAKQEPAFEPIPPAPPPVPIALTPPAEPPLRASPSSDIKMDAELHQPPTRHGRGLLRFVTLVFAGIAATIAWQVYGHTAREKIAGLAPQLLAATPAADANAAEPQPQATTAQAAAPETPPAQAAATPAAPAASAPAAAAPPAQAAAATPPAADAAQSQAALPPDVTQRMEAMSREIASLKQTVEQLKAGQLQMNRDLAKTMEHQIRQKVAAPPAKQTSVTPPPPPQPQRTSGASPPPSPQPAAAAPAQRAASPPPTYGQPQMYGQSQVYDRPANYRAPPTYGRGYDDPYDRADLDRDVYAPPPSPNYQPGYTTVPRPPMPLQ